MSEFVNPYRSRVSEIDATKKIFRASVGEKGLKRIRELYREYRFPVGGEGLLCAANSLKWSVVYSQPSHDLFTAVPGVHVGTRVSSRILEAAKTGRPSDELMESIKSKAAEAKSSGNTSIIKFNVAIARPLSDIEIMTGVEDWGLLLNHSVVFYNWMMKRLASGNYIVGLNRETNDVNILRPLSNPRSDSEVVSMISGIDDWTTTVLPVAA